VISIRKINKMIALLLVIIIVVIAVAVKGLMPKKANDWLLRNQRSNLRRQTTEQTGEPIEAGISRFAHAMYDHEPATGAHDAPDVTEQLTNLAKLHRDGFLSDEELKTLKEMLIRNNLDVINQENAIQLLQSKRASPTAVLSAALSVFAAVSLAALAFSKSANTFHWKGTTLACGDDDTLALVKQLIDEKIIDKVIKLKLISLPQFSGYLDDPSTLDSGLSQKDLKYKFGGKGTATAPQECYAELSISGSVVVSGSPVNVSLDRQVIQYSITKDDDGSSGVLMRGLDLALALEVN
jgi:hypothetical protein